eukprot:TRINITY_DN1144_c0_g1_i1.p1 TRINITY_DN1144_c0_g1~~TRINITY_DN1144_c0_g1_i1.p1  ORF type:complete len:703 (-),score=93.12 TRINITY_DN1144_c0_g1_i1:77-2185(-)
MPPREIKTPTPEQISQIKCCHSNCFEYFMDSEKLREAIEHMIGVSSKQRKIYLIKMLGLRKFCNSIMDILFGISSDTMSKARQLVGLNVPYYHNNIGNEPKNKTPKEQIDQANDYILNTLQWSPMSEKYFYPPYTIDFQMYYDDYVVHCSKDGLIPVGKTVLNRLIHSYNVHKRPGSFFGCDRCFKSIQKIRDCTDDTERTKLELELGSHRNHAYDMYQYYRDRVEALTDDLIISIDFKMAIKLPHVPHGSRKVFFMNKRILKYFGIVQNIGPDIEGTMFLYEIFTQRWEIAGSNRRVQAYIVDKRPGSYFGCDRCFKSIQKIRDCTDDTERTKLELELGSHRNHAYDMYQYYRDRVEALTDDLIISIDFKMAIKLPHVPHGSRKVFFMNKRILKYFGIVQNIGPDIEGTMFLYEIFTQRWEVVVNLLDKYLNEYVPHYTGKLVVFSDNCTGEMKNQYLLSYFSNLVDLGRFQEIEYITLEAGHAKNNADRTFGADATHFRNIRTYSVDGRIHEMQKIKCISHAEYVPFTSFKDPRPYLTHKFKCNVKGIMKKHYFKILRKDKQIVIINKLYPFDNYEEEVHDTRSYDTHNLLTRISDITCPLRSKGKPSEELIADLERYIPLVPLSKKNEYERDIETLRQFRHELNRDPATNSKQTVNYEEIDSADINCYGPYISIPFTNQTELYSLHIPADVLSMYSFAQ